MAGLTPVQASLAEALRAAGQDDAEIAEAIGTDVADVAAWGARPTAPASRSGRRVAVVADAPPPSAETIRPAAASALNLGSTATGAAALMDLEELLTTRLLVQGNSGSGKSHLLRRLLEGSASRVQQVVIDPEGDFASLGEAFGHTVIDAHKVPASRIAAIGARVRAHRGSIVLNLGEVEQEAQMDCAAALLGGLFDAPREHWAPVLVVIDEAQLFASTGAGDEGKETWRASLAAVTNLMCRGRKRGLAGVLATQRLAKLHKNVAAECSNFLMGRTYLDNDMARAADLLGLSTRQAEVIRDLERGEFLALGPAVARRPVRMKIGAVTTAGKNAMAGGLPPPPVMNAGAMQALLLADEGDERPKLQVVRA